MGVIEVAAKQQFFPLFERMPGSSHMTHGRYTAEMRELRRLVRELRADSKRLVELV